MLPDMKITLAQVNPTVGDIDGNAELVRRNLKQVADDCDLVLFPEGTLPGYPAQDLVLESAFLDDLEAALRQLARETGPATVIVGTVRRDVDGLYNSAAILRDGEIQGYRDKVLLPTYDVFDEARYFTPADRIEPLELTLPGGKTVRLGLHICEDLWDGNYGRKVIDELAAQGADLLVNISASPYRYGIGAERQGLIKAKIARLQLPYVYCNLVGGQDELVFDGHSMLFNGAGELVRAGAMFREDFLELSLTVDLESPESITPDSREGEIAGALVLGIKDYFRKTGHQSAVIGLSGGIDSSLVAVLASQALGAENVTGVIMPSTFNAPQSGEDAQTLAANLGIRQLELPIESLRLEALEVLAPVLNGSRPGVAEENLQARLRGLLLMAIANRTAALVLTTGNKTELALGYATLYGDMAGALAPIGDLSKTDVYALARHLNGQSTGALIPESVLTRPPSAELRPDQTDPFDYDRVAPFVENLISRDPAGTAEENRLPAEEQARLRAMIRRSEHKRRQAAPVIRVTGKAFGSGRRYPIANRYA